MPQPHTIEGLTELLGDVTANASALIAGHDTAAALRLRLRFEEGTWRIVAISVE